MHLFSFLLRNSSDSSYLIAYLQFGWSGGCGYTIHIFHFLFHVRYINQKRTQEMAKAARLYLPAGLAKLRFDTIISKSRNIVNGSNENLTNGNFLNKQNSHP